METYYYIQGIHPVRIIMDEDMTIESCHRFDFETGELLMDMSMVMRVENDLDCQRISEYKFWEYIHSYKQA